MFYGYQIRPVVLWPGFAPRPVPTHLHLCGGLFKPSSVDKSDKGAEGLDPGTTGVQNLISLSLGYWACLREAAVCGGWCLCSAVEPPLAATAASATLR